MVCMLRRFWRRLGAEQKLSCDTSLVSRSIYEHVVTALTQIPMSSQLWVRLAL